MQKDANADWVHVRMKMMDFKAPHAAPLIAYADEVATALGLGNDFMFPNLAYTPAAATATEACRSECSPCPGRILPAWAQDVWLGCPRRSRHFPHRCGRYAELRQSLHRHR